MSDLSKVCERLGGQAAAYVQGARLADLEGYWLEVQCCGGMTLIPLHMLIQRRGRDTRLRDVMAKLACKRCHRAPRLAYLNETHNRTDIHGAPPGWSVQLIPAPALASYAEAAE